MSTAMNDLVHQYIELLSEIYGNHLKTVSAAGASVVTGNTGTNICDINILFIPAKNL